MATRENFAAARARWRSLTLYNKFEHFIILILTGLIAVVIAVAVWNLTLKVLFGLVIADGFDPTDQVVFQTVFGMIFTVIIALEFKRSLLVAAERRQQHRSSADRDPARDDRHCSQVDYFRSRAYRCAAVVRACGGDTGARRCLLAGSRTRQTRGGVARSPAFFSALPGN